MMPSLTERYERSFFLYRKSIHIGSQCDQSFAGILSFYTATTPVVDKRVEATPNDCNLSCTKAAVLDLLIA
jgi:hypothetical protein